MALTFVQSKSAKDETGTSTAPSLTTTGGPAQGNLMVCVITANEGAGDVTISLSGWTGYPTDGDVNLTGQVRISLFYKVAGAGESSTITGSLSAAREWSILYAEFNSSAAGGQWITDQSAQNTNAGSTTPTSGTTSATTRADEVCVSGLGCRNQSTLSAPLNTFVIQEQQVRSAAANTGTSGALLYKIVSATGTQSTGGTYSANRPWASNIATFASVTKSLIYKDARLSGHHSLSRR
jgi:hypothetical protein